MERHCPVDCVVSLWGGWNDCSASCGPGTQNRTRGIQVNAAHGGSSCEVLGDVRSCNLGTCAVDCVNEWTLWSECSKTCGTGTQSRSPVIITPHEGQGQACPAAEERLCNPQVCPTVGPTPSPTPPPTPEFAPTPRPTPEPSSAAPILTIQGNDHVVLEASPVNGLQTHYYHDAGARCVDSVDGDISGRVAVSSAAYPDLATPGQYALCYDCKNKKGTAATQVCREILVRDTSCPTCTVTGEVTETIEASFPYHDAGAVCTDALHPGVALPVTTVGAVDTTQVGTYVISYSTQDAAGNYNDGECSGSATYTRTITVIDTLKPVIGLHLGGKLINHGAGGSSQASGRHYGAENPAVASLLSQQLMAVVEPSQPAALLGAGVVMASAALVLLVWSRQRRRRGASIDAEL